MSHLADSSITVVIPTFRCNAYIRRAVESILAQTHARLTLVVVNDGDPNPPWPQLAAIDDPRLVRFDLVANRGPYFAIAVVLAATDDRYLLIQDADDWSEPDRLALLLRRLDEQQADAAVSANYRYMTANDGRAVLMIEHRGAQLGMSPVLPKRIRHLIHHHGLFRTDTLRALGGYFGGFKIGYDTLMTNLLLMCGTVVYVDTPLYHRCLRPESLTIAPTTGHGSPQRKQTNQQMRALYDEAFTAYNAFRGDQITREELRERLSQIALRQITPEQTEALAGESQRLRALLTTRSQRTAIPTDALATPHRTAMPKTLSAELPLVSCILIASSRRTFVAQAISYFLRQTYPHRELIVVDDGDTPVAEHIPAGSPVRYVYLDQRLTRGEKRNTACELARGTIIAHWNADDWQAAWRLRYQVALLEYQHAALTWAGRRYYYCPATAQAWLDIRPAVMRRWLSDSTLCYRKALWERQPFAPVDSGADRHFLSAARRDDIAIVAEDSFCVGLLPDRNSGPHNLNRLFWRAQPVEHILRLLGDDADFYIKTAHESTQTHANMPSS